MITRRPTLLGTLTWLAQRLRRPEPRRCPALVKGEPWEPGMREWITATLEDIIRVRKGIRR